MSIQKNSSGPQILTTYIKTHSKEVVTLAGYETSQRMWADFLDLFPRRVRWI